MSVIQISPPAMPVASGLPENALFGRVYSLQVTNGLELIDLSALRFKFQISAADIETPSICEITVYNLNPQTREKVIAEGTSVILQAGYVNAGGPILLYNGTVRNTRSGKENSITPFLKLFCSNDDDFNAMINTSLGPGATPQQVAQAAATAMNMPLIDPDNVLGSMGGIIPSPRGKVMFGFARSYLRSVTEQLGARWTIENNTIVVRSIVSQGSGQATQLNAATGMIGIPESTENGIIVRSLLNPLLFPGRIVQLNNGDIVQSSVKQLFGFPQRDSVNLEAVTTMDGFYRVIVAEHQGDSRGIEWYTDLVCLAISQNAVLANG